MILEKTCLTLIYITFRCAKVFPSAAINVCGKIFLVKLKCFFKDSLTKEIACKHHPVVQ